MFSKKSIQRIGVFVSALAVTLFFVGCDSAGPNSAKGPEAASTNGQAEGAGGKSNGEYNVIGDNFEQLFSMNLKIRARPGGGQTAQFQVEVRKQKPVDMKAKFNLVLPELTPLNKARARGKEKAVIPLGKPLERSVSKTVNFRNRTVRTFKRTVQIPEPGYYMVMTDVRPTKGTVRSSGQMLDRSIRKKAWLWVGKKTTKITDTFKESVFPDGYYAIPGPLTPVGESPGLTYKQSGNPEAKSTSSASTSSQSSIGEVELLYTYLNPINYVMHPLDGGMPVEYEITDEYEGRVIEQGTEYTDSEGKVSFACDDSGYQTVDTEMPLDQPGGNIDLHRNPESGLLALYGGAPLGACGQTFESRISEAYWAYKGFNDMVEESEELIGVSRSSALDVYLTGKPDHPVITPPDEPFYLQEESSLVWSKDGIYLVDDNYWDGSSDEIRIYAHEWGHAIHDNPMNRLDASGCPASHNYKTSSSLACAYYEGFAEWHSAVVRQSDFFEDFPSTTNVDGDGATVEGYFAAFLHDMVDPMNESHDNVHTSPSYVADVIGSCEIDPRTDTPDWKKGESVDYAVSCFQNEDVTYNGYFTTRNFQLQAEGQRDNASDPGGYYGLKVRVMWKDTLYPDQ